MLVPLTNSTTCPSDPHNLLNKQRLAIQTQTKAHTHRHYVRCHVTVPTKTTRKRCLWMNFQNLKKERVIKWGHALSSISSRFTCRLDIRVKSPVSIHWEKEMSERVHVSSQLPNRTALSFSSIIWVRNWVLRNSVHLQQ